MFRAPGLLAQVAHGPAVQYWVVNAAAPALMGPIDLTDTWWIIALDVEPERGDGSETGDGDAHPAVPRGAHSTGPSGSWICAGAPPWLWKPPSTWSISPVTPRERSLSKKTAASATGVASVLSHFSGAT